MKHVLTMVVVFALVAPGMAMLGLPIADDACSEAGLMRIGGGVTLESDVNLYGGRFTYGVTDELALFGGVGIVDPDHWDSEPYFQVGGTYRLPVQDIPFDLAVRAAFGMTSFEDSYRDAYGTMKLELDFWTLNAGLLGSKKLDVVTVYGLAGISYAKSDAKASYAGYSASASDSDTELAVAGGVIWPLDERISFYGELAHIDDLFISLGARFQF